jgi:trk system potassium uptake protein TrkA
MKKKRGFAVIGLGNFGFSVAKRLYELNHDVIAVDINKEKVQDVKDFSTQAIVADVSDKETLESLGMQNVDVAVVSLGDRMDTSALTILYLKELGVKDVVVKALTLDHGKVLELIGATKLIFPERDMAIRTAERLSAPNILDQIDFLEGYSVVELAAPRELWDKTLKEANVRANYGIAIVVVKRKTLADLPAKVIIAPHANEKILPGDILVIIGEDEKLNTFKLL